MRPANSVLVLALTVLATGCGSEATAPEPSLAATDSVATRHSGPIRLAALMPGDSVVIDVEMWGCFHHSSHVLSFTPTSIGAALSLTSTEDPILGPDGVAPRSNARGDVSPGDLARLDRMLEYYRSERPDMFCTSSVQGVITLYQQGRAVAQERFDDSTCPDWRNDDLLSLGELVYRMNPPEAETG